jgi:phosphoribosylformimino-5-aminoimidazole carboxamide ribotide isomerase
MRVIGVVDLLAGCAVHARAGRRESYAPVRAVAGSSIEPGDAVALARAYVNRLGLTELYAADLDAILGRRGHEDTTNTKNHEEENWWPGVPPDASSQDTLVAMVAAVGPPLWLDAGVSCASHARHALGLGAANVVVGLETLPSYDALGEICDAVGGDRVAFSLDLREGEPIVATGESGGIPPGEPAHRVVARAAAAGAGAVIVIDLARVGTGRGLDLGLISRVRDAAAGLTLLAGGGVRGMEDIARLADAGCDGALVATALHDGRLTAADVASLRYTRSS